MDEFDRWSDQEADRLTRIMVDNPHAAAEEMRQQLSQLDLRGATMLIAKTKNLEYEGGLGDLQIQVELDQNGCDSGYRNVTMATPDGIEQIAELRSNAPDRFCQQQSQDYDPAYDPGYDSRYQGGYRPQVVDPLSVVAGMIVGDLLWNQRRGVDFRDDRYRDWCDRERFRENNYMMHRDEFRQNWQDREFRQHFQTQDWRQNAWSPAHNYFNNPLREHH
ncbi:MAG: hypothetical protein JST01_10245, partial [Cyanobacteria bacterium SZAS TMP-1]|nr:hypothetical protein [Cyanobacteria bacterium SZAS TMP-1]